MHLHHHHQTQNADPQATFLQHHHHPHPNGLSGLSGINVVGGAVFTSDLHGFQDSFETVPHSGVVSHQTSAAVPVHPAFEGVDGLPVLLDQDDLLSQSRDRNVELGQQQHARKQLPRQRQQQRSATTQPQNRQTTLATTQLTSATTNQGHYSVLTPTSLPEVRALSRVRDEPVEGFPGSMESGDGMGNMDTSATSTMDMGAQAPQEPGDQLKKQTHSQLSTKTVPNPPNLEHWRQKLFDLEDTVVLNHDE